MLGLGFDLGSRRTARHWWQAGSYPATSLASGSKALPSLILDNPRNLASITTLAPVSIGAASLASLSLMNAATFSDVLAFTRASGASFVDSAGSLQLAAADVPRFDHSNGRRQLLLEGPATNLCTWSEGFNNSVWVKNCTVASDTTVSPAGSQTADTLTGTVADASCGFPITPVSGQAYTFSVWMKVPSGTLSLNIYLFNGAVLATRTVTLTTAWQRFSVTGTPASTATMYAQIGGGGTFNAANVIHAWGTQIEAGTAMSSYVATAGATASRAADSARFGLKAEALLARNQYSIVVRGQNIAGLGTSYGRLVGSADANPASALIITDPNPAILNAPDAATFGSGSRLQAFGVASAVDRAASVSAGSANGGPVASSSTVRGSTAPLFLGRDSVGNHGNGWYDQVLLYPFRLANSELQRLAVPFS